MKKTFLNWSVLTLPVSALSLSMLSLSAVAENESPWLPIPGQWTLGVSHTQQQSDSAYIGDTELAVSAITSGAAANYDVDTTTLRLGYGWSDQIAFDLNVGYAEVDAGAADKSYGGSDSVLGVNVRIVDEYIHTHFPTLTLRGAAIVKGGYDEERLASLGKNANGFELAAMIGKQISPLFAVWGEIGGQNRGDEVPNATFYNINGSVNFLPQWTASAGYRNKKYSGDLDIGGSGFSPARFQEVQEERGVVKLGVDYAFATNQGVAVNVAQVNSGRNTVKDDRIWSLSYTYAFAD